MLQFFCIRLHFAPLRLSSFAAPWLSSFHPHVRSFVLSKRRFLPTSSFARTFPLQAAHCKQHTTLDREPLLTLLFTPHNTRVHFRSVGLASSSGPPSTAGEARAAADTSEGVSTGGNGSCDALLGAAGAGTPKCAMMAFNDNSWWCSCARRR